MSDEPTGWYWAFNYRYHDYGRTQHEHEIFHTGVFAPTDPPPPQPAHAEPIAEQMRAASIPFVQRLYPLFDDDEPDVPTWNQWRTSKQFTQLAAAAQVERIRTMIGHIGCTENGCYQDLQAAFTRVQRSLSDPYYPHPSPGDEEPTT